MDTPLVCVCVDRDIGSTWTPSVIMCEHHLFVSMCVVYASVHIIICEHVCVVTSEHHYILFVSMCIVCASVYYVSMCVWLQVRVCFCGVCMYA